jgi:hypothetical protein
MRQAVAQEQERDRVAKENALRRKQKLREIEENDDVDLKSALKQRRSKKDH